MKQQKHPKNDSSQGGMSTPEITKNKPKNNNKSDEITASRITENPLKNEQKPNDTNGRETQSKVPWWKIIIRIIALIIATGAAIIMSELFVGNILLAMIGIEELSSPVWSAIYSALAYIMSIAVLVFLPRLLKRISMQKAPTRSQVKTSRRHLLEHLGLIGFPTWKDIGLAPVGYIAYLLLASGLMMIFALFPWFNSGETQSLGFSSSIAGGERILAFLTLVIVAPIAEEIIFRGWLYDKIKRELAHKLPSWARITVATILVSILFGIVHLQWNVGVGVFALSVIMCLMREITGTTYAGILLHMLKNGIAFYLLFVLGMG